MSYSHSTRNPSGGAEGGVATREPALHIDLMEQVLAAQNMRRAWRQVKANRGAPGIDSMRIEDFPAYAHALDDDPRAASRWPLSTTAGATGEHPEAWRWGATVGHTERG